jgi:hypothetical protein
MVSAVEIESLSLKQEQPVRRLLQRSRVLSDIHKNSPLTPSIGQEFTQASIHELLTTPNSDALLRDLAITVSQRGVVFFPKQRALTTAQQKKTCPRSGRIEWQARILKTAHPPAAQLRARAWNRR